MIEGPQLRALEREALPFFARLQSHLGRAGRRGILENNDHALDVALVIPDRVRRCLRWEIRCRPG